MNRDEIVERTRRFLRELLHDPAAELAPDEPLLSAGVITSFDLVSVTMFMEKEFGVTVPDAWVSRDHLDSLDEIASCVLKLRGAEDASAQTSSESSGPDPLRRVLPTFRSRPLGTVLALALLALAVDRGTGALLRSPRVLEGLEGPDARRMNYNYQDYERALERHELGRTPKAAGEVRIVFQGDSGTFGSYLEANEACPAVLGDRLAREIPGARVYNVSYFGQTFVKDAEMLEAVLPYAPDLLIVSCCSIHWNRELQQKWWLTPPTTPVYNRPLFRRFLEHAPGGIGPELAELDAVLAESERRTGLDLTRAVGRFSSIAANQLVLQGPVRDRLVPDLARPLTRARGTIYDPKTARAFRGKTVSDAQAHGQPFALDVREVALLEAIIDRARAGGVEVALFCEPEPTLRGTPPERIPWNAEGWRQIQEVVEGIARRKGVTLVSCLDLLPQDEFLDSERHWTVAGNAAVGEKLARELAPLVATLKARRSNR